MNQDVIDEMAGEILHTLSRVIPDIEDNGELGELVLERALETYRDINLIELKGGEEHE